MKKAAVPALVAAVLFSGSAVASCDNPAGKAETSRCLGQQLHDSDARINAVYKQLMGVMSEGAKKGLRDEQRAWLKKRDATCSLDSKESDREKWMQKILEDSVRTVCVVRFTQQRVEELEARIAAPESAPTAHAWELGEESYELHAGAPREKGKWYFEVRIDQGAIAKRAETALYVGLFGEQAGGDMGALLNLRRKNASDPVVVLGIAADLDQGKYYSRYAEWDAEPGSAAGADLKLGRKYDAGIESSVALAPLVNEGLVQVNFGDRPFEYPLPAGYQAFRRK